MKKFQILILAFVALAGFNSCSSEDDVVFTTEPDPEGISFVNTFASTYVLTPATAENNAERFVWNEIELDVPTNISYELQGSTSADFQSFTVLGTSTDNNVAVTVQQLMDLAEEAGLDNDPETEMPNTGTLYFRVVASAGTAGELAHVSEVQSLTVMLPEDTGEGEINLREFYFVGNATPDNWNNNGNNIPLFRDADNPDVYYYTGKFNAGEFKLLEVLGQWQPQWGLDGGNVTSSDILGADPGAFVIESAGYYSFEINVDEMTYSLEPYDASGATTYETIGLIGDATPNGWDSDIDMTQLEFNPHIWYLQDVALTDGKIKFRAGDAWDVSWGTDSGALSDKTSLGGPDIPVEEGVYDIWFNDLTGRYILIPLVTEEE